MGVNAEMMETTRGKKVQRVSSEVHLDSEPKGLAESH